MANVILAVGAAIGDEGKGNLVGRLASIAADPVLVVRVGGPQAAHNVVTADGRHHTFAQFGSGTFVPGCRTHLSRNMMVNPVTLESEGRHLSALGVSDCFERMTIEEEALVTSPFQMSANRIKEMVRDRSRHGSCGLGIGETVVDALATGREALRAGDLSDKRLTAQKLRANQERKRAELHALVQDRLDNPGIAREWAALCDPRIIDDITQRFYHLTTRAQIVGAHWLPRVLGQPGTVIFENSQGVLLDQYVAPLPYATRVTTTFAPALELLAGFDGSITRMGVVRTYMTRHGAGPMVTEDPSLNHPEAHNGWGPWQQGFRQGHFDFVLLRYAVEALRGVDQFVVTHMDRLNLPMKVCTGYRLQDGSEVQHLPLPTNVEEQRALAVTLAGARPVYTTLLTRDEFLARVESETGSRINFLAHGPSVTDWTVRSPLRSVA